jgi:hypothetical protein
MVVLLDRVACPLCRKLTAVFQRAASPDWGTPVVDNANAVPAAAGLGDQSTSGLA